MSKWKTGYSEPNFDDLIMLSKYFDVSTDYLLGATEKECCDSFSVKQIASEKFSAESLSLLEDFRSLPRAQRAQAAEYVRYLAERFSTEKNKKA